MASASLSVRVKRVTIPAPTFGLLVGQSDIRSHWLAGKAAGAPANDRFKPSGCRWSQIIAAFRPICEPLAILAWRYRAEGKTPDEFMGDLIAVMDSDHPEAMERARAHRH